MDIDRTFEEMKNKIESLRRAEASRGEDVPISLQMESDLYAFSPEEKK